MTNKEVINFLDQVRKILLDDKSWLESTIQPINEAFDMAIDALTAQLELTDGQAIEHLRESGWMQNHDKQMYEMGLREQLADDSDSYDALLPSAQPELAQDLHNACTDAISRQAAIDAMANTLWQYPSKCYRNLNEYAFAKGLAELGLKSVPSAQPDISEYSDKLWRNAYERGKRDAQPEIIHCRECKHWKQDHTCREHSLVSPMMANEFCSRAERRKE